MDALYLLMDGEQKGPFRLQQVKSMYHSGSVTSTTYFWREGQPEWLPIDYLFHPQAIEAAISRPNPKNFGASTNQSVPAPEFAGRSKSNDVVDVRISNPLVLIFGILLAIFLPPLGLIMGLIALANPADRKYGPVILAISALSLVVWIVLVSSSHS